MMLRTGIAERGILSVFRSVSVTSAHCGRSSRSTVATDQAESFSEAKPFSAIPGPRNPLKSAFSAFRARDRLHEFFSVRHDQYGPIYKEWMGTKHMVFLSDPDGVAQILRQDGKYPARSDIPVMRAQREQKNELLGIVLSEGEEWHRLRSAVNKPMMRIQSVAQFFRIFHEVTEEVVDILARKCDSQGLVDNLEEELFKWSLESSCAILYDRRLGCLKAKPEPEIEEFIKATVDGVASLNVLLFVHAKVAQLAFSKQWNDFARSQKVILNYTQKCVDEKIQELAARGEQTDGRMGIIEHLVYNTDMTREEVYANIRDIMPAAIDTTSISTLYALHQLAAHPDVQEKLHDDITRVIPPGRTPTFDDLQELPLLKAIIKETMRLFPVASILSRVLQKDAAVLGYQVPKQSTVLITLYTMGRNESIFKDAERFYPDRWLRGEDKQDIHPFASLPFGFGTRMCVGRRLAELEMQVILTEIVRRFRLEPVDSAKLQMKTAFLTVPSKPVRLRLVNR